LLGVESSVNGILATGSLAYASVLRNYTNTALQFATNNIVRATITSAGNIGIGTSSPLAITNGATLHINGTSSAFMTMGYGGTRYLTLVATSGYGAVSTTGATPLIFETNEVERMRITSGGTVHFKGGNLSDLNTTALRIDNNKFLTFYNAADNGWAFGIIADTSNNGALVANNALIFATGTSATDRGRITSGGNWLLGTSSDNGERLYVSGSIRATGSITANSDVRLKKNIERIENALQKVSEISGYTYNTIYDEDRHAGVIAQEIDKVLPEIVNKGNDGLMGVEYGNISALLIEAIKDLKVQNDSLLARLSALEK
jgi:hypothetical protein